MSDKKRVAASDARNNFSEIISKVQYQKQVYLIERYGEIVAQLVPVNYRAEEADEEEEGEKESEVLAQEVGVDEVTQAQPVAKSQKTTGTDQQQDELRNLREMVKVTAESSVSQSAMVRNHLLRDERKKDGSQEQQKESADESQSAARSALKKLEELIEARKQRQTEITGGVELNKVQKKASIQNQEEGQDEQDKPEIIRKKIEL